ncbi:thiol reductant ABC exporter subunit CydD [Calidifontibacter indicus]|uniref:thiol reductant ABC exporter subunit CydD n=1 Tax=Calidifontibacter indicus TaxID=419650 RepID=UPI003D72B51D
MKPFDPRLVKQVPATRVPVLVLGVLGGLSGVAAIASAFAIAALVVALVRSQSLGGPALAVVVVFLVRSVLALATEQVASWAATRISGALRADYLRRMLATPADQRPDTASLMTVATHGASSVEPYVARYLPSLVAAAVVPPLAVLCLLFVDWSSALIVLATLPLLPVFAALIGRFTQDATQRRWQTQTRLAGHFLDVMRGLPTLVSYGRAEHQAEQVSAVGDRHRIATVRTLRIAFLSSAALELLATISVAIVAVWTGMRLAWGDLGLGIALTAILLAPEAYWPIRRVGQEFHAAADGAEAIEALLPADGVAEPRFALPGDASSDLRVDHLGYHYPGTDRAVIDDLSFTVRPGLTVLVGPSGCGKTTLLELIAGLRTPSAGSVPAVRSHLVTQTPFIAPMTVRQNLLFGVSDDSRLAAALAATGFDAVLRDLPDGLETPLGDNGFGLSAGQRAKLALTRAWLSDADLLLVDEPTAHLDPHSADELREVIVALAIRRPVVAVTHDEELVARADHRIALQPSAVTPGAPSSPEVAR